jgi:hypothetical protein
MKNKKQTRAEKPTKSRTASRRCAVTTGSVSDSDRLDWLAKNHASLSAIKEPWDEGVTALWWQVTQGKKSLSGHVLSDPRAAIDAAMRGQNRRGKAQGDNL